LAFIEQMQPVLDEIFTLKDPRGSTALEKISSLVDWHRRAIAEEVAKRLGNPDAAVRERVLLILETLGEWGIYAIQPWLDSSAPVESQLLEWRSYFRICLRQPDLLRMALFDLRQLYADSDDLTLDDKLRPLREKFFGGVLELIQRRDDSLRMMVEAFPLWVRGGLPSRQAFENVVGAVAGPRPVSGWSIPPRAPRDSDAVTRKPAISHVQMARLSTYDVVATDDPTILASAYAECYRQLFPDAPELGKPLRSTFVPWIPDGWHWAIPPRAGDLLIATGRDGRFHLDVEDRRNSTGYVRDAFLNNVPEPVRRLAEALLKHRRGLIVCGSPARRTQLIYQILWLLEPVARTMIGFNSLAACRLARDQMNREFHHLAEMPRESRRVRRDFTSCREHVIPRAILTPIMHQWWEHTNEGRTYRLAAETRDLKDRIRIYQMLVASLQAAYGFLDRKQKLKPEERAALVRTFGQVIYEE